MSALLLVATATLAYGSSIPPYLLTPANLDRVCSAEVIFIGTITSAAPYWKQQGWGSGFIHSHVTFLVERDILAAGQQFSWSLPGGSLDGETTYGSSFPRPEVGARYFVALTTAKSASPSFALGEYVLSKYLWLDPQTDLPPVQQLKDELDEACGGAP